MKIYPFLLLSIALFTGCSHVFKQYDEESFPSYTWANDQSIKFSPEIKDTASMYELAFGLRHVYGLQVPILGIEIEFVSPSGKKNIRKYEVPLMNNRGEYISSCGGDLCDIEKVVDENLTFDEVGVYSYSIRHTMPTSKLAGIMEVGLIIDKKK